MKPIYVIVNDKEKTKFEKQHQIPYGYKDCYITYDLKDAVKWYNENLGNNEQKDFVVEKHQSGYTAIVYPITN